MRYPASLGIALSATLLCTSGQAATPGERWLLSAGGGLTRAVSTPQADLFGLGASGTGGFYRSLMPWVLLGTRFTASVVGNDSQAPEDPTFAEPGTGGLFTLTLSTRLRPFADRDVPARATGFWVEGGGGVARTGALWRPAIEAGIGYGINVGPIVLSPTVRFQQIIEGGGSRSPADGRFGSAGFEITFNDGADEAYVPSPVFITMHPLDSDYDGLADVRDDCPFLAEDPDGFQDDDGCPEHDVDKDGFADNADDCPLQPETENGINDYDGCPDTEALEMVNGVIVVDEKILFGFDSAKIRDDGLARLRDLAESAGTRTEWEGLVVEGHADVRGTRRYNRTLSIRRARAVQRALQRFGLQMPIEAVGFGEERPIDRSESGAAHRRNRRVEIHVKERQRNQTAGASTVPVSMFERDTP